MMASISRLALAAVLCTAATFAWAQKAEPPASEDPHSPEANSEAFPEPAAAEVAAPPETETAPAPTAETPQAPAPEAQVPSPGAPEPFPGWDKLREDTGTAMDTAAGDAQGGETAAAAPPAESGWKDMLKTVSALLFVLALIVACYFAALRLRRHAPMLGGGSFAEILGRLHLDPRYSLHFVRVADRVLLIGTTQQNVNLLATLDPALFDRAASPAPETGLPQDFLAQLRASGEALNPMPAGAEDEEVVSLRSDIERLKRYLEEGPHRDSERP